MTDEELIEGLRKNALWVTTHETADRIEQLVADNKRLKSYCGLYAKTDRLRVDYINSVEAKLAKAVEALSACVLILDATVKESGRSIDYDEEDPFRMGEWFENSDLANIEAASNLLIALEKTE